MTAYILEFNGLEFTLFQVDETLLFKGNTEVARLPLQITWLHVCLAISCNKNQILVVVNGVKVLETHFEKTTCPTKLVGNLVLLKAMIAPGFWTQAQRRVTNVNVFSGLMSQDRMVSLTSGKECGKQNGDLLSWANSSWSLEGAATKWIEVSVEDLCFEFSSIQLFTTSYFTESHDCNQLCQREVLDESTRHKEAPWAQHLQNINTYANCKQKFFHYDRNFLTINFLCENAFSLPKNKSEEGEYRFL